MPIGWIAGGTALAGVASSIIGAHSANKAADAQADASAAGIAEQQRQFDAVQKLLAPYAQAGTGALNAQQNLVGLNGNDAQSAAISSLQASPAFTSAQKTGNDAILANASATGGLRGGNVQAALGQFSPALLTSLINQQYSQLGGLTSVGQNAAAGTGNAGMATGNQISALLQQQGAAQAGGDLAQGRAITGGINAITGSLGTLFGGGYGGGFGSPSAVSSGPISNWTTGQTGGLGFGSGLSSGYGF